MEKSCAHGSTIATPDGHAPPPQTTKPWTKLAPWAAGAPLPPHGMPLAARLRLALPTHVCLQAPPLQHQGDPQFVVAVVLHPTAPSGKVDFFRDASSDHR